MFVVDQPEEAASSNFSWLGSLVSDYIEPRLSLRGIGTVCPNNYAIVNHVQKKRGTKTMTTFEVVTDPGVNSTLMTSLDFSQAVSGSPVQVKVKTILGENRCVSLREAKQHVGTRSCMNIAQILVLVTNTNGDESCFNNERRFAKTRSRLRNGGVMLNAIMDERLRAGDSALLGIDASHLAYSLTRHPTRTEEVSVKVNKTWRSSFARLALELGGSVWDIREIRRSDQQQQMFGQAFATEIARQMRACRLCSCRKAYRYRCSLMYTRVHGQARVKRRCPRTF